MKLLVLFLLVVVGSVSLALILLDDPGYVLLAYDVYTLETSLAFFVLVLLLGGWLLLTGVKLLMRMWRLPDSVHDWRNDQQREKARKSWESGLQALAEGHWHRAEKQLLNKVGFSDQPMLNYLFAARAAQYQGHLANRDHHLQQAAACDGSEMAVGLTQAKLQIDQHQREQALATLQHLHQLEPKNRHVALLLARTWRDLEDWRSLHELLPVVQKLAVFTGEQLQELERQTYMGLIRHYGEAGDSERLQHTWHQMPRAQQESVEFIEAYVAALLPMHYDEIAERIIRKALKKHWHEGLVLQYGKLDLEDVARPLKVAETWVRDHGKSPVLLLTLGRLCLRNRLWGKARIYFESSLAIEPQAETYRELAQLLEQLEDHDAAMKSYRDGMRLLTESTFRSEQSDQS